jgi:DNA-binding GntR family transcriptional regulator
MEAITKIERINLSEKVYRVLKREIANHRFLPRSHLNVEKLTRDLGVSRTPVWEAIRRLEQEGYLTVEPKKGVLIQELTPETAIELYTVREALEALAIRAAIDRIGARGCTEMERCLNEQKEVIDRNNLVGYSQLDFEFHGYIYTHCNNKTLQEMLENIKNKSRPIAMLITPILPLLYHDHVVILEALRARDAERAEKAIRKHIVNMIEKIKEDSMAGDWSQRTSLSAKNPRALSSQSTSLEIVIPGDV